MRHPVSTLTASRGGDRLRGAMSGDVVRGTVLPAAPEDSHPRAGQMRIAERRERRRHKGRFGMR